MAMEIDKLAFAGLGLMAKMQDMIQDLVEGREKSEDDEAKMAEDDNKSWKERFEELAEVGEERYETLLDKGKEEREKVSDRVKERANKVFSELGLVTKEDLEELEAKLTKLQRAIKKASSSKV